MSLHKTYTEKEIELLKLHGLYSDRPSQMADAFIIGFRYALDNLDEIKESDIGCNYEIQEDDESEDSSYYPCQYCGDTQCDCDML